MKNLNITFDEAEWKHLRRIKEKTGMTWEEFLKYIIKENEKENSK